MTDTCAFDAFRHRIPTFLQGRLKPDMPDTVRCAQVAPRDHLARWRP